MNKGRFKLFAAVTACGLLVNAAFATDPQPVTLRPDIDITIPRVQIHPPVSEPLLQTYEELPSRLFFNISGEPSYRLETNPYQAPHGYYPFYRATQAFRIQSGATLGYALTRTTRVSANYFILSDHFDDFTPFHLDSTVQSVGTTLEQDLFTNRYYVLRSSVMVRELFLPNRKASGDILPSLTLIRGMGAHGYGFANASLDLGRDQFAIGDSINRLTPIFTLGTGYQFPYDQPHWWQKALGGTSVSLSSTYSYNKVIHPLAFTSDHSQNIIITAEVARDLSRKIPVQLFARVEPVFNFGSEYEAIGVSGFDFRLFGGARMTLAKPPIFTTDLKPKKEKPAKKNKAAGGTSS